MPEPAPHSAPPPPARRRRRKIFSFRRTIRDAADTLTRAVIGMPVPTRFRRGKPGAMPGIEHADLAAMPSTGPALVTCIDYGPDQVQSQQVADVEVFLAQHRPEWCTVRWINVDGLSDMKVIRGLAEKYHLHPLAIEDLLQVPQRPKVDPYIGEGDYQARLFLIARMNQLREHHLHSEQVSIFLGHSTVLTFQETHGDVWDPIRQRINTKGSRLRTNDASFLVYSLVDALVDHCFPILEYYGDRLHELEEMLIEDRGPRTVQRLHDLNRDMMLLRRQVWPMRDLILQLQREEHECLSANTRTYLRDVYDHVVQVIDMIETYREIAASVLESYATFQGNKLNEVVKVLTVLTAIFTPPTFFASVWGMNFKGMPEIDHALTYPWIYPIGFWGLCLATSVGMVWWFKRRGWL